MSKKTPDTQDSVVHHIRRCHVCGGVSEASSKAIHQCAHCGKHLAPFYYFDESSLDGLSDVGFHLSLLKKSEGYNPLWGLSTYWQDSDESHT